VQLNQRLKIAVGEQWSFKYRSIGCLCTKERVVAILIRKQLWALSGVDREKRKRSNSLPRLVDSRRGAKKKGQGSVRVL